VRNTTEGSPSGHTRDQVEIQSGTSRTNRHTIRPEVARGGRYDGYAFLRLNQREESFASNLASFSTREKNVRSARSNDGVENNRRSFSVKSMNRSFARSASRIFLLFNFVIAEDRNQGSRSNTLDLSVLAALKRKGPRDGDIDLASVTCLVQFTGIEIMECKLYVRIFQFVSANEVRQEESVAER